jgi:predicted Zn-dependent protease with MMP-like domain
LVKDVPDYADARHLLGSAYEELGDERNKVEQFLEVLRLDEGLDEALEDEDAAELENLIVEAAEQTISGLSEPFRERLESVPILVEPRPSEDLVREGFDPRAFGLFEGPTHVEHQNGEASEVPTRIVLYASNLLAESLDEDQLREEVETTVLHEVGHYFGLDEDDLARLGLD